MKPSRFGGLRRLTTCYDYLAERGIGAYGGGQFELGPGRGQIQYLASLFHPDTPNDVAPGGYNLPDPSRACRRARSSLSRARRAFAGGSGLRSRRGSGLAGLRATMNRLGSQRQNRLGKGWGSGRG